MWLIPSKSLLLFLLTGIWSGSSYCTLTLLSFWIKHWFLFLFIHPQNTLFINPLPIHLFRTSRHSYQINDYFFIGNILTFQPNSLSRLPFLNHRLRPAGKKKTQPSSVTLTQISRIRKHTNQRKKSPRRRTGNTEESRLGPSSSYPSRHHHAGMNPLERRRQVTNFFTDSPPNPFFFWWPASRGASSARPLSETASCAPATTFPAKQTAKTNANNT